MTLTIRLICAVFALLLTVSASFAAPAVLVVPNITTPTARTSVQGTGFGAFTAIDIYYDTAHLCVTFANSVGAASCTIKVPKDAQPYYHWVSMIQRNNGTGAQAWHLVRTDWAQFHGRTAAHAGNNPHENTLNASNVAGLDVLWTAPIGPSGAWSTPAVAGGKVYIGGRDGKLYAFNSLTGALVAGFPKYLPTTGQPGSVTYSSPAVGYGRVFIGADTPDNRLHAFNATTGAAVSGFPKQLGGGIFSSPALAYGNVYVGSNDGLLNAFSATTGAVVPGFPRGLTTGSVVTASPSIANGRVYIGTAAGSFHGFDALTGIPLGVTKTGLGRIVSTAAVAGGAVYFGSIISGLPNSGQINAYFDSFGESLPRFPGLSNDPVLGSPAVGRGMIISTGEDGFLRAHRQSSGAAPIWTIPLDNVAHSSPVIAGNVIFVNSFSRLYAVSFFGEILWSAAIETIGYNSPAVSDGIVYIASSSDRLYAFSLNGEPVSARRSGGALGVKPALSSLKPVLSLKATK